MSDIDSFFLVQVLVGVVCVPPSFRCVHEKALTCVWPNTLLSDSKLEKLVILRMNRDSMVHMRKQALPTFDQEHALTQRSLE